MAKNKITKRRYCKKTRKRRFPDKNAAVASLHCFQTQARLDKPTAREVTPQRAYYCKACNGFHLTSQK